MRIDAIGLLMLLAVALPLLAAVVIGVSWRRWQAATFAKVLTVIGVFVLLVPGTCFGIVSAAEALKLLAPTRFQ